MARHVDGETTEVIQHGAVVRHPLQHLSNHPAVNRGHAVVSFRGIDQFSRRHDIAQFVLHGQQDFVMLVVGDGICSNRLDLLAVENQAVFFQRGVQLRDPLHGAVAFHHPGIAHFIFLHAIAAGIFGGKARLIRVLHEFFHAAGTLIYEHQSDARAYRVVASIPFETDHTDGIEHVIGKFAGRIAVDMLCQNAELVATQTRDLDILVREFVGKHLTHLPQQFVAGFVPAGVVDDLELIQVDIQQRMLNTPGFSLRQAQIDHSFEFLAVH